MNLPMNAGRIVVIFALGAFLAACNTIEGAGKDIESGGEAIQDGSKTVKKKL